jgi:hypothetical protein
MGFYRYYLKVLEEALRFVSKFLGFSSKVSIVRAILLWAITTLCIYFIANESLIQSRLELRVSSVFSIVLLACVVFIVSLFRAPVKLHDKVESENAKLKSIIDSAVDMESRLEELSRLYYEGKKLYDSGFLDEEERVGWERSLNEWERVVETKIKEGFSISELHKFRQPQGFSYFRIRLIPDELIEKHKEVLERFTAHISNLNDIVEFNSCNIEAAIKYDYESCDEV